MRLRIEAIGAAGEIREAGHGIQGHAWILALWAS